MKNSTVNLKHYRKIKKMSIKQLSKCTNLSASYLYQVERGDKEPSFSALNKIAKALDTNTANLIKDKPQELKCGIDLSSIPTVKLIEELNKRKDFLIKLKLKMEE